MGRYHSFCRSQFRGASEVSIVTHPVFSGVTDRRSVCLLHLKTVQAKSVLSDLCKELVTEILHTRRAIEHVHPQRLTNPLLMIEQGQVERILTVNEQAVIVFAFQPRLDHRIKVTKQSADISISLDLEKAPDTVSVPMQISALVLQSLVAVSRIEFVVFFNDHDRPAK